MSSRYGTSGTGKTSVARDSREAVELEAAEALAVMARSSSSLLRLSLGSGESSRAEPVVDVISVAYSQDQPAAADCAPMLPVESNLRQMSSTNYQSIPHVTKTRHKLTRAEKEERKARRILANRESARQTIRRRKELHLELTRKAAEALEWNEHLKKEKELALKDCNSLKCTYEFLKARLDEVKKAAAGLREAEPEAKRLGRNTTSTGPPLFWHKQPSIIPCFWPPVLPSSDIYQFPYPSHSHNTSLSQFAMSHGDIPGCSHQGHEHNTRPLLVYPVPWVVPLLTHATPSDQTSSCNRCSWPDAQPHEDTNQLPLPQNIHTGGQHHPPGHITVPSLFSPVRPLETPEPPWRHQVDDISDVNVISNPEDRLSQRQMKPEDMFAASMARRRRKELMKLKKF